MHAWLLLLRILEYRRGEQIFSEGSPSDRFYLIASGRVKVFKTTPAGKDVILEIFGAGDPLGAVAVYEGWPFSSLGGRDRRHHLHSDRTIRVSSVCSRDIPASCADSSSG